jgi:hypothetical protein
MKNYIKLLIVNLFAISSLLFITSCYFAFNNLGPIVDEERNVGEFSKLKVSTGIDVKLSQGNRHMVIIKANEDIIDDVETEVVNGTLKVYVDRSWFRGGGSIDAEITFVELNSIDVSAGSDVESEGLLTFNEVEIEASSGSDLKLNMEASSVNLRISSGSDANLKGSARNFKAKASSGSDIHAYDFEVENAMLECSSGSDVKAHVTETLSVKASSGSDIYYRGDPKLMDVSTSGGSDLHKRD